MIKILFAGTGRYDRRNDFLSAEKKTPVVGCMYILSSVTHPPGLTLNCSTSVHIIPSKYYKVL